MKRPIEGQETPRIHTPPLSDLTPKTSAGFEGPPYNRPLGKPASAVE